VNAHIDAHIDACAVGIGAAKAQRSAASSSQGPLSATSQALLISCEHCLSQRGVLYWNWRHLIHTASPTLGEGEEIVNILSCSGVLCLPPFHPRSLQVQEAYDTLSDPAKRREYDSTDEFDDTLPLDCKPADFFKVRGEVLGLGGLGFVGLGVQCEAYTQHN
jgi:hypothetical protein